MFLLLSLGCTCRGNAFAYHTHTVSLSREVSHIHPQKRDSEVYPGVPSLAHTYTNTHTHNESEGVVQLKCLTVKIARYASPHAWLEQFEVHPSKVLLAVVTPAWFGKQITVEHARGGKIECASLFESATACTCIEVRFVL